MNITLNQDQKLYVFKHDDFTTCRGFQSLFDENNELAKKLKQPELRATQEELGSLSVYEKHGQLIELAKGKNLGTFFNPNTNKKVRKILEDARINEDTLRLFYGDNSGKDWLEECDVLGNIGRSTGILKIPLLISPGKVGGPAILDNCIIRIIKVATGKELYCHDNYHRGTFTVVEYYHDDLEAAVHVDGQYHAGFKSMDDAYHWLAFMTGKSFLALC